jgi:hypothetical protein
MLQTVLVHEFLPVYDVSDAVATLADADVATTWDALMQVDLIEVGRTRPMVGLLGALRALPEVVSHLLHGESPPKAPKQLRLLDTTVYSLSVRAIDERRTLLSGVVHTATTDEQARKWFSRYWTLGVWSGAHIVVSGVLDLTREITEAQTATDR